VKKVLGHALTCRCDDCAAMFPGDRFEAAWTVPQPGPDARRVEARLPLGHPQAPLAFVVWVDADQRLLHDWPGFPGTVGARLEVQWYRPDSGRATGTRDVALGALADPVPLTRRFAEAVNARCMVAFGLAPDESADLIACDTHGAGAPATACACVAEVGSGAGPREVFVFYDVHGAYPDLVCADCVDRFASGDLGMMRALCSHCQQARLLRHRVVGRTWYGADRMID
jgi:hypothetical protein